MADTTGTGAVNVLDNPAIAAAMAVAKNAKAEADVRREAAATEAAQQLIEDKAAKRQPALNADGTKKLSPKNREVRKVPAGYKTTWVPLDLPADVNEIVNKVAKHRDVNVGNMLAAILKPEVDSRMDAYKKDADDYDLAHAPKVGGKDMNSMTLDELTAFVAAQQTKMAALQAQLEARKTAAPAAEAAPEAPSAE